MGSDGVVLLQPLFADFSDFCQAIEKVQARHLLAIRAIETLDVSILGRLAWLDEI